VVHIIVLAFGNYGNNHLKDVVSHVWKDTQFEVQVSNTEQQKSNTE
jgi:hypothetical protein